MPQKLLLSSKSQEKQQKNKYEKYHDYLLIDTGAQQTHVRDQYAFYLPRKSYSPLQKLILGRVKHLMVLIIMQEHEHMGY